MLLDELFGGAIAEELWLVVRRVWLVGTCCDDMLRMFKLNWPPLTNSLTVLLIWSILTIGGYWVCVEGAVAGALPIVMLNINDRWYAVGFC